MSWRKRKFNSTFKFIEIEKRKCDCNARSLANRFPSNQDFWVDSFYRETLSYIKPVFNYLLSMIGYFILVAYPILLVSATFVLREAAGLGK